MRKLGLIGIFLGLVTGQTSAQWNVELHVQGCSFKMNDLKALQQELFVDPIVPVTSVTEFPPYLGFKAVVTYSQFEVTGKTFALGAALMYTSTGGRVQYKDFSGSLTGDQLTHAITAGVLGRLPITENEKWQVGGSVFLGAEFTSLTLENTLEIGSEMYKDKIDFSADGFVAIPSVYCTYTITDHLYLIVDVGYHLTMYQNTYRWSQDSEAEIFLDSSNEPLKPNWDGFRAGVGVGYFFSSTK